LVPLWCFSDFKNSNSLLKAALAANKLIKICCAVFVGEEPSITVQKEINIGIQSTPIKIIRINIKGMQVYRANKLGTR
jgi:hypothetical protein